jgi:hypothetical protein
VICSFFTSELLIFEKDIACNVGNVIRRETGLKANLLSLYELILEEGDWIDIGEPLVAGQVFSVTVKPFFRQELGFSLSPASKKVVFYAKVIKYFSNGLVNNVIYGLWLMIKRGYRGQYMGAHVRGHGHEPEMPFM